MSELPAGWAKAPIGALGEIRLGKMLDKAKNQGLPAKYLRNINVRWFHFDLADMYSIFVSEEEKELLAVEDGDLFVCEGGEPGRCAVWRSGNNDFVYQKALHRFRSNGAMVPELLMYCLCHQAATGLINDAFTGTTIKHFTKESFAAFDVPVPPLAEQQRLADKLDTLTSRIDACRERLKRVPGILKRFRQSVLAASTTGALTRDWREERNLTGHWPVVALESVATDFSYGSAAKSSTTGRIPVLRMGNIQDGQLAWEDLVYTSDAVETEKYKLSPGDVLFNRTNSPALVGKTAVFQGEREAIYAGYLIRVRCGEHLLPAYLNYCLGSPAGRDWCWRVKSDGVSQSNINARKLAAFTFGLPGIPEQMEIIRRAESLLALQRVLGARLERASQVGEALTPSTLAKAFRGELVPQDPSDEPASAMIDRMRMESPKGRHTSTRRPPIPSTQRHSMRKADRNSLKEAILCLPSENLTFEQISTTVPADYEHLKDALFDLLDGPTPALKQVFDEDAKMMRFMRVRT